MSIEKDEAQSRSGRGLSEAPSVRTALMVGAVLALLWGSTWLGIKWGLRDLPALGSASIRFVIAAFVMTLLVWRWGESEDARKPGWSESLVAGFANFGISYAIVYLVEMRLPSGLVAVLWSTYTILMAVLGHLFVPGESLKRGQWVGVLVGFAGVCALFVGDLSTISDSDLPWAILLLMSPLTSALGHVVLKRRGPVSSLHLNRNGMAIGALVLSIGAFSVEGGASWHWTPRAWASLIYLALFGTVVTFGLYYWLFRFFPANRLGLVALVIPAVALVLGVGLDDELLTPALVWGTGLILTGVALVLFGDRAMNRDA